MGVFSGGRERGGRLALGALSHLGCRDMTTTHPEREQVTPWKAADRWRTVTCHSSLHAFPSPAPPCRPARSASPPGQRCAGPPRTWGEGGRARGMGMVRHGRNEKSGGVVSAAWPGGMACLR